MIIENLRDSGTTLNEDILVRMFNNIYIEKQAVQRVASDAGNILIILMTFFVGQMKANNLEIFNECMKKIAYVVESKH